MKAKKSTPKPTKNVAWNPVRRKWEEVFAEDEVEGSKVITLFWNDTIDQYVSVPDMYESD